MHWLTLTAPQVSPHRERSIPRSRCNTAAAGSRSTARSYTWHTYTSSADSTWPYHNARSFSACRRPGLPKTQKRVIDKHSDPTKVVALPGWGSHQFRQQCVGHCRAVMCIAQEHRLKQPCRRGCSRRTCGSRCSQNVHQPGRHRRLHMPPLHENPSL